MWLPPVDPAGSPRVGHKPSPRTARVENPYIPPKFKGRPGIPGGGANTAPAGADDGGGGGYSHNDAAVPEVDTCRCSRLFIIVLVMGLGCDDFFVLFDALSEYRASAEQRHGRVRTASFETYHVQGIYICFPVT